MSVCLIVQKQDEIFIGTDTAVVSPNANNKYIRIGECEEKFFVKGNIGFYCSGRIEIANKIREYINNNGFNLEQILDYFKLLDKEYRLEDSDIELLAVSLDRCLHIAKYNNFEPIEYKIINNGDMYIISAGFKVPENYNTLYNYVVNDNKKPLEAIRETIKDSMCQEIGGKCKIFHLNKDGFKLVINERLDNLALRYKITNAFLVNGEVLIGKLIAGNQLVIKNSANTFLVDENGAKLKNAELSVENDQNKILLDPDNGFKIQKKVETVWTNMIYLDENGNAHFEGDVDASKITGSSFVGGDIDIGDGKFTVDSEGNLVATSGKFTSAIINDSEITGTSINVANNFIVDKNGNVVSNGDLSLLGNIRMGGNITWDTPVIQYQYSTNNSAWHTTMTSNDKYRRESLDSGVTWQNSYKFVAVDGINGSDVNVNDVNVFNALTEGGKFQGIFSDESGKLYMNAQYIRSGTLSGVTIDVDTEATIGKKLIINADDFLGGIEFRYNYGMGEKIAEIYVDPAGKSLNIEADGGISIKSSNNGKVYLNNVEFTGTQPKVTGTFG